MSKPEMKPGDVRTFKRGEGNAVVLAVGVWATRETEKGPIRIDITGPKDMHTTVTNNPGSERYHRTLFRDLRRVLLENKCWPFGDEGSETEVRSESGMTTHDIIWKFTQQLNGGITSEPQVVYLLAGIRKLMEHDQIEDKFVNLKFHCDWTLHSRLSGEAEHQILRLFDAAYPILTRYEKQTSRRVDRISEMRLFEEELSVVLLNYGLPPLTIKRKDGWISFPLSVCQGCRGYSTRSPSLKSRCREESNKSDSKSSQSGGKGRNPVSADLGDSRQEWRHIRH